MIVLRHYLRNSAIGILALGLLAGALFLGLPRALATTGQEKAEANASAKIRALKDEDLKKLIAGYFFKNAGPNSQDSVDLSYVTREDVILAGVPYTLIFIDSDDLPSWKFYKDFLPPQLAQAPAGAITPTDEQVEAYVTKLSNVMKENYLNMAEDAYKNNKALRAKFPADWPEENIRGSIFTHFEMDGNGPEAPEAQRAYNEYMAVERVRESFNFYNDIKGKL